MRHQQLHRWRLSKSRGWRIRALWFRNSSSFASTGIHELNWGQDYKMNNISSEFKLISYRNPECKGQYNHTSERKSNLNSITWAYVYEWYHWHCVTVHFNVKYIIGMTNKHFADNKCAKLNIKLDYMTVNAKSVLLVGNIWIPETKVQMQPNVVLIWCRIDML